MMKKLSELETETKIFFWSFFLGLLTIPLKISNNVFETFMFFAVCYLMLYASRIHRLLDAEPVQPEGEEET